MVARILSVVGLAVASCAYAAQSQPPSLSSGSERQAPQQQADRKSTDSGALPAQHAAPTAPPPATLTAQPAVAPPGDTYSQYTSAAHSGWDIATTVNAVSTVVMAVVTVGLLCVAILQKRTTERQRKIMARQTGIAQNAASAAKDAAIAAAESVATAREIERAYIHMSHAPPGLYGEGLTAAELSDGQSHDVSVSIKVANAGNTPATVTATALDIVVSESGLPDIPIYGDKIEPKRLLLVKGSSFHIHANHRFPSEFITALRRGQYTLYVIGYTDYIDKFGRRHRTGYARFYSAEADQPSSYVSGRTIFGRRSFDNRNNLPFFLKPGYNYDRERKQGEGNDWGEPPQ